MAKLLDAHERQFVIIMHKSPGAIQHYVVRIDFSSILTAQCNVATWQTLDFISKITRFPFFSNTEQVIEVFVTATHSTSQKELKTEPSVITLKGVT